MSTIKEAVIYSVKPEFVPKVEEVQRTVRTIASAFKGFKHIEQYQSTSDPAVLLDWLEWDSLENAKLAQVEFEKHPDAGLLFASLQEMKFADHFILSNLEKV
jgi:hypothetical protein